MKLDSYFKIALRHLWKERRYTGINIFGLVLGSVCCLFIASFITSELSYDKAHPNADQLYRLIFESHEGDHIKRSIYNNPPLADLLRTNLASVENTCRIRTSGSFLVRSSQHAKSRYEESFLYADPTIFDLFSFPFAHGDPSHALDQPFSIVLSKQKAYEYFGEENATGGVLYLNNNVDQPYQVTGILDDNNDLSHLSFDFCISLSTLEESRTNSWTASNYPTYLRVSQGTDVGELEDDILQLAMRHKKSLAEEIRASQGRLKYRYSLQPIKDIYLHSHNILAFGNWSLGDPSRIWYIGLIGGIIFLLALINFINLTIAHSLKRAREVGIRKVLGSGRKSLILRFLIESVIQSIFALCLGVLIVYLLSPFLTSVTAEHFQLNLFRIDVFCSLFLVALVVGLLAGIYPAIKMASFSTKLLKQKVLHLDKGHRLRTILVTTQFIASAVLIALSLVIYQQRQFAANKKLGFQKSRVIVLEDTYTLREKSEKFKTELLRLPRIKSVTQSNFLPVDGYALNRSTFNLPSKSDPNRQIELERWFVDQDYLTTLGMNLVKGRDFEPNFTIDTNSIILNETAAALLNRENPIGSQITINQPYTIIGVVEDFHYRSIKQPIRPLAFHRGLPRFARSTIVKVETDDYGSLMKDIESIWHRFTPNQVLRHHFLDERFDKMYQLESRTNALMVTFTLIALLIAGLGLFAMATFSAERRRKEFSIRKVLGASISHILSLQFITLLRLVIVATIISLPITFILSRNWLDRFAYRMELSWTPFVFSAVALLLLVGITVSWQSLRVALDHPVRNLRED